MGSALGRTLVAAALISTGCSSLVVERTSPVPAAAPLAPDRNDPRIDAAPAADRIDYNLPMASIVMQAVVTLNDCDNVVASTTAKPTDDILADSPPFDVTEDITATVRVDPDPAQQYTIRVDRTRSWTKQLMLSVGRAPNHILVSYNGTLVDQAGPAVVAAIGTAVAIGGAVAMPAVAPVALAGALKVKSVADSLPRTVSNAMDRKALLARLRDPPAA